MVFPCISPYLENSELFLSGDFTPSHMLGNIILTALM